MKSVLKLRNKYSTVIGHARINTRHDDTYIAAYPRSGSTWLRTIISNILEPAAKGDPDVFNARIPAVSIRNAKTINALESPRLIMTHSHWLPDIKKAVYVLRNGRDSFISSYHYHVTRNGKEISLDEYWNLYLQNVYGNMWHQHVESWLRHGRKNLGENLKVVYFEDLKSDINGELLSICEFLGIEYTARTLQRAIEYASLEHARKIEFARQGPFDTDEQSFYRSGASQQKLDVRYQSVLQSFDRISSQALSLAGYQ